MFYDDCGPCCIRKVTVSSLLLMTLFQRSLYLSCYSTGSSLATTMTTPDNVRRSTSFGTEEVDRNSVFGMSMEDAVEGVAHEKVRKANRRHNGVIQPPSSQPKKSSRAYTRPVFKDPGSKMAASDSPINLESCLRKVDNNANNREAAERSSSLVHELIGEVRSLDHKCDDDDDVIHPSRDANKLLLRLSSRPSDFAPLDNTDKSVGLEKSMLRKYDSLTKSRPRPDYHELHDYERPFNSRYMNGSSGNRSGSQGNRSGNSRRLKSSSSSFRRPVPMYDFDDQTECGGSIATVSDLDNLAAKALRRKKSSYERKPKEDLLTSLKKEIQNLVGIDERDDKQATVRKRDTPAPIPPKPKVDGELKTALSQTSAASKTSSLLVSTEKARSSPSEGDDVARDAEEKLYNNNGPTGGGTIQTIASVGLEEMWCEATLLNLVEDLKGLCSVRL
jgi:hypothetical protein